MLQRYDTVNRKSNYFSKKYYIFISLHPNFFPEKIGIENGQNKKKIKTKFNPKNYEIRNFIKNFKNLQFSGHDRDGHCGNRSHIQMVTAGTEDLLLSVN